MRLIDADTLRAEFTGNFHEQWHYTGVWAMIDCAPSVDAVPVVRCKDCKHWEHEEDVDFVCKRHYGYRASLDFCSQGERKEKE